MGHAQPLPHPEGVVPQAPARLVLAQPDHVEDLLHLLAGQTHRGLRDGQHLSARSARVLSGGVE